MPLRFFRAVRPVGVLSAVSLCLWLAGCSDSSDGNKADGAAGSGGATGGRGGSGGSGGTTGGSGGATGGSGGATGGSGGTTGGSGGATGGSGGTTGGSGGATGGRGGSGGSTGGASGSGGGGRGGSSTDAGMGGSETGSSAGLDQVCTPKFTLKLMDTGPKGMLFLQAMGGSPQAVEQTIHQMGREICRALYRNPTEVRGASEMELTVRDYDGVAGKWGDLGKIGVEISTRHIQNVKNEGRDVAKEVKGILYHEMTHMYQHDDKPEGTWSGLAAYYEAGADAVRIRYGYAPDGCRPGKNGQWYEHSYCTGGWWWLWVDTKYPDFMYKLNLLMRGRDGKAFKPEDATAIAGVSLDALWTEYKSAACCSGTTTTCCK